MRRMAIGLTRPQKVRSTRVKPLWLITCGVNKKKRKSSSPLWCFRAPSTLTSTQLLSLVLTKSLAVIYLVQYKTDYNYRLLRHNMRCPNYQCSALMMIKHVNRLKLFPAGKQIVEHTCTLRIGVIGMLCLWLHTSQLIYPKRLIACASDLHHSTQRPEHYEIWSYHFWVNFPSNLTPKHYDLIFAWLTID